MSNYTSAAEFESSYATLFSTFSTGITKSLAWRKWQLKQVWWMLEDNEADILKALNQDLDRHDFESHATDLLATRGDVLEHIKHVEKWAEDTKPDAGFMFGEILPACCFLRLADLR
jgi:aldehyde dehydrogenase (NAD+)